MEQTIEMMTLKLDGTWFNRSKSKAHTILRWINVFLRAVIIAMFVPSEADRKIEESRERVRRYLMRS